MYVYMQTLAELLLTLYSFLGSSIKTVFSLLYLFRFFFLSFCISCNLFQIFRREERC